MDIRVLYPLRTYLVVSGVDKPNVMAADWVTPLSFDPPLLGVSVSKKRYSYSLIKQFGEFVIAVPTAEILEDVWKAGSLSGRNMDKIKALSITLMKSKVVSVPSIRECIANIECRLLKEIDVGDHQFIIGKIEHVSYDKRVFHDDMPDLSVRFLLHLGRNKFTTTSSNMLIAGDV